MRKMFALVLPLVFLAACSSSTPERATDAPAEEKAAARETDECLDNPERARTWGDCNVKHALYAESAALAECRRTNPSARGSVDFELKIHGDGTVRNAKAVGRAQKTKLVACLTRVMKTLQFAPTPKGKSSKITIPYQLEP